MTSLIILLDSQAPPTVPPHVALRSLGAVAARRTASRTYAPQSYVGGVTFLKPSGGNATGVFGAVSRSVGVWPPELILPAAAGVGPVKCVAWMRPAQTRARRTFSIPPAPVVVFAATVFSGPGVTLQAVAASRRAPARKTRSFLGGVVYSPTAPVARRISAQVAVAASRRAPRRAPLSFLGGPVVVSPNPTIVIGSPAVQLAPKPRTFVRSHLSAPVFAPAASTFVAAPVATHLSRIRPRPTRSTLTSVRYAAASAVAVHTVTTRPRPTRHLLTAVSYPQTSKILVSFTRSRPRPTGHALTAVAYPSAAPPVEVEVFVRTVVDDRRRRQPRSLLTSVSYPALGTTAVHLVRVRPRPTTHRLTAVTYAPAATVIGIRTVAARPRRTIHSLTPITYPRSTAPAETEVAVTTVVDDRRRRQPRSQLTFVSYPALGTTAVHLVRVRPRPTRSWLTAVAYPQRGRVSVTVVRSRPRRTTHALTAVFYPKATPVAETEIFVSTVVDDRRRRLARSHVSSVVYPATGSVAVHLVRARPRRTTHTLSAVAYEATSAIRVKVVRTRPRVTRWSLTDVRYEHVAPVVEETVAVTTIVDDRRRRQPRSFITAVSYPEAGTVAVHSVRTRPRPTMSLLGSVSYPATSEIVVVLTRTRPPRTSVALTDISYPASAPPAETEVAVSTVVDDRRRRAARSQLAPPVFYPATSQITTALVRARPSATRSRLPETIFAARAAQSVEARLLVVLAANRPRRLLHPRLSAPVVLPATSSIATATVTTRPRHTRSFLLPPATLVRARQPVATTLLVKLVRTRPPSRFTRLARPAVVGPPAPPSTGGKIGGSGFPADWLERMANAGISPGDEDEDAVIAILMLDP